MDKDSLKKLIDGMDIYVPIRNIELSVGMPITTLQKSLKGIITLPKKWEKPLLEYAAKIVIKEKESSKGIYQQLRDNAPVYDASTKNIRQAFDDLVIGVNIQDHTKIYGDKKIDNPLTVDNNFEKQIDAINAEEIPKERSTFLGRKVWALEQAKKIEALSTPPHF